VLNLEKMKGFILEKIFKAFMARISPEIEKALENFILQLHEKALKTPNHWDDVFTGLLIELFDIKIPEKVVEAKGKENKGLLKPV